MLSFRFLLMVLCLGPSLGWRSYDVDFTGYSNEVLDMTVIKEVDLQLVPFNKHHALNGSVVFGQDLNEFEIEGRMSLMRPQQEPVEIVNTLLDGCETLESRFGSKTHVVTKWVMREIREMNSSFPERCPILKDQRIVFNNFFVGPERLPPYLVDMNLRMAVHVRVGGRYIFKSFLNFAVFRTRRGVGPKKTTTSVKTSTG